MWKLKYCFVIYFSFLILAFPLSANVIEPLVKYNFGIRMLGNGDSLTSSTEALPAPIETGDVYGAFDRFLNTTTENIKLKIIQRLGESSLRFQDIQIDNDQKLLIVDYGPATIEPQDPVYNRYPQRTRAIYIIKNQVSIGYCIFDAISIPNRFMDDPVVVAMRTMKNNKRYLADKLQLPPKSKLDFHETIHNGYIERYAFFKKELTQKELLDASQRGLVLDAFYPQNLETLLEPYIVEALNLNMVYFVNDPLAFEG